MKRVGSTEYQRVRSSQKWLLRMTAVATLAAFSAAAFTANGSAAVLNPALVPTPAPVAKKVGPKKKVVPPAETFQERQDRIAQSPRSLLKPLEENKGKATVCVSGEFTSLRVVYDSIVESLNPSLPPQARAALAAHQKSTHRDMENVTVSTLAIADNPTALGADRDDPQYRSPLSNILVNDLLKIRDGQHNDAIPVRNITLTQAVETAWLYIFMGVLAPLQIGIGVTPNLGSPLTETPLAALSSLITYNQLVTLTFTGSRLALQYLYQGIATSFINQCVARVTEEQRELAGKPSEDVIYDIQIVPIIAETANQLALADKDTCQPIGDLSLGRIVQRTSDYAASITQGSAAKKQIETGTKNILAGLKRTYVPHNLIPADPADFSQIESIGSMIGGLIPRVGGAPLDILIGLGHNLGQGDNLLEQVSLADLTVTKSLTAAYYAYYLSLYLFTTVGGLGETALLNNLEFVPGFGYLSPIRVAGVVLGLPLTYGLVTYHHVVRTMCLREDDTTGTGRGAQRNREEATLPSASTTTPTATPRRGATRGSSTPSTTPRRGAASTTTTSKPVVPGLPVTIPGLN